MANLDSQNVEVVIQNGNETNTENSEDVVNPWNVVSSSATGVDYDKLIC